MRIVVIGAGYVGLVTASCFAEMGNDVTCLDIDAEKIAKLKRGEIPIYEPGLAELVQRNGQAQRLTFSLDYKEAVSGAKVCFLAVDTPTDDEGNPNLSSLNRAVDSLGSVMEEPLIVVTKSTVPVGTTKAVGRQLKHILEERCVKVPFSMVSNPEFLKEGHAVYDFMKPDRVVIGVEDEEALRVMRKLYAPFMHNHERLFVMDILSSETTKYAANAMLATRISFMNEIANFCEKTGADVTLVRRGIGSDTRIGYHFLYPGPGFGGSCFPKDLETLRSQAKGLGCKTALLDAVVDVNARQKQMMGEKIRTYFEGKGGLKGKTIAILGLSFKPDTDDMRKASSLVLIPQLLDLGAKLRLYDPAAMDNAKKELRNVPNISWCDCVEDAVFGADAFVLLTEWRAFRFLDFEMLASKMSGRVFFDARNQYVPKDVLDKGFSYISVGRKDALLHQRCIDAKA